MVKKPDEPEPTPGAALRRTRCWCRYKDDRQIKSDVHGGVMITQKVETELLMSVLTIKRSKMTDAGEYLCQTSELDVGRIDVRVLNGQFYSCGRAAASCDEDFLFFGGNYSSAIISNIQLQNKIHLDAERIA